jgi:hypothetical protein
MGDHWFLNWITAIAAGAISLMLGALGNLSRDAEYF